jgi:hypothetical protein
MKLLWAFALLSVSACAASFAQKIADLKRLYAGENSTTAYAPLYWDENEGKLFMELPRLNEDFLYVTSLPVGLGQNDLELDRGQIRATRVVRFERTGPKVFLVEPNFGFRSSSNSVDERRSVEQSFPQSIIWGFKVEAEDGNRVLVDATDFFVREAGGVIQKIKEAKEGEYNFDSSRSAVYLPSTKVFPKNTEVEVTVTLTSEKPGALINQVAPEGEAITLREHHSFIELPGSGYTPRAFDPRAGYFSMSYYDFGTPFSSSVVQRVTPRHRLAPGGTITYYVDRGVPLELRQAVITGASWWSQAFSAAGFPDAFKVELLPPDADPMDVRYNVITWVNRSTRGWSYGDSIKDPRTGEIIKGQVTLGSLRARQDYLIAEGLLAPYESGTNPSQEAQAMVVARITQLAAHEVGHTLGLAHNYAASTHDRASVMDYPHPLIEVDASGVPKLGKAYAGGIGEWDKVAIAYGYSVFPPGTDEKKALDGILKDSIDKGLVFLTDEDARPAGSVSPIAHLWDNGPDAIKELIHILDVRRHALDRFGERNIREGAPMSTLEDVLVPIYLLHRYQVEAVSKLIGGSDYRFALRGDGQKVVEMVAASDQKAALDALLLTLRPETLAFPDRLLNLIPPPATGYERTKEDFPRHTGLAFDPLGAAESAANQTLQMIFNGERASRLVEQHSRDANVPGFSEVSAKVIRATWKAPLQPGMNGEIQRVVNSAVLYQLMALANDEKASAQARAIATSELNDLQTWLGSAQGDAAARAHYSFSAREIKRFLDHPKDFVLTPPADLPPGQPIGEDQ